ncbi:helix-turn-helix domain-containing protein [Microbacterium sp. VKM Ac-2870]|nr:helix-turn-helix domain-containing protein [Microbacterium sp. VKM Ac-2870]
MGEVAKALARDVRPEARVPGRARRVSTEETAQLIAAYHAGATVEEVAHQFGMHDTTVSARLADTGVVLRSEVRPNERQRMLELFSEGLSMNQIGRRVGRDPKTVRATLVSAGITPPQRSGAR